SYLMLHRVSKKNDLNKDKWIGVGGHFEAGESPEECLIREVEEETGYTLNSWQYRGIVTFISGSSVTEYMSLFTSDDFAGEQIDCDEGKLEWVRIKDVPQLNLWPGDRIFLKLLEETDGIGAGTGSDFFSLKLVYDEQGELQQAVLNGKELATH
ncbi:MAG: 8-oxo-dGTP diphosphatase, partial [Lachnospiraceae bacterium]